MTHHSRVQRGVPSGGQFAANQHGESDVRLYFHVAPQSAWESIESHGLDHARGESAYDHLDYPPGNYLFADPDAAVAYAEVRETEDRDEYGLLNAEPYDVFEVTLPHDVEVHQDPFHDDESGLGESAVYTTDPIPAEAIRRQT